MSWILVIVLLVIAILFGWWLSGVLNSDLKSQANDLESENSKLNKNIADLKDQLLVAKNAHSQALGATNIGDADLAEVQKEVTALVSELKSQKDANAFLRAQMEDLEEDKSEALGAAAIGDADLAEVQKEITALVSELKSQKDANAFLRAQIEDLEEDKSTASSEALSDDIKIDDLKEEVGALVSELRAAKQANEFLRASLEDKDDEVSGEAYGLTPAGATPASTDDLTKVEGIGPKIQELCNGIGIHTYDQLAYTPIALLQQMLDDAGSRFTMHKPGTWPAQSSLAAQGLWDQLKAWQDVLDGGKM